MEKNEKHNEFTVLLKQCDHHLANATCVKKSHTVRHPAKFNEEHCFYFAVAFVDPNKVRFMGLNIFTRYYQ